MHTIQLFSIFKLHSGYYIIILCKIVYRDYINTLLVLQKGKIMK